MTKDATRVRNLSWISIAISALWYGIVLCGLCYVATRPPTYQNWWMIPWMWGAWIGWIPFTLMGLVTGVRGIKLPVHDADRTTVRRIARVGIAMSLLSPLLGPIGLYVGAYLQRL